MLPQRRHDNENAGNGRGGFEVHVIGRGKPVAEEAGGGLEIGLRIGAGTGERRIADQSADEAPVHRLEVADTVQARPMSEAGPAVPRVSRRKPKRGGLARMTVWMAVATVALVVASVAGLMAAKPGVLERHEKAEKFLVEEEPLETGRKRFLEQAGELALEAETMLAEYAEATSAARVLPMIRDAEGVKALLFERWEPWGGDPAFARGAPIENRVAETSGRPSIQLTGRKGDFTPFRMMFVLEGDDLKLDWLASHGIGDVQLAELRAGTTVEDGTVRAVVRTGRFFTSEFPEERFRSYQLMDAGRENLVWAFARRDSAEAEALEGEFNEGSILLEKTEEFRATLKLSGPAGEGVKFFVITEMLHKGWVTP